jgi:hypothetical protein
MFGVNTDLVIVSGERVEVMTQGIAWVEAGAAITIGALVTADSVAVVSPPRLPLASITATWASRWMPLWPPAIKFASC